MRSSGVYFSELRLRFKAIAEAKACWTIVLLILGIQGLVSALGGHDEVAGWYEFFGLSREGLGEGKLWQTMTYGLLHGGFVHAVFNALCVVLIGSRIEHMLGGAIVWKAMLTGVLIGGITHLLLTRGGEDEPILVGASGGCIALLLLLVTLSPDSRMWPIPVSARALGVGVITAELALALIAPQLGLPGLGRIGEILAGQGLGGWFIVSHACHFGGGVAGIAVGAWMLRPRVTTARLRRARERRESRVTKSLED